MRQQKFPSGLLGICVNSFDSDSDGTPIYFHVLNAEEWVAEIAQMIEPQNRRRSPDPHLRNDWRPDGCLSDRLKSCLSPRPKFFCRSEAQPGLCTRLQHWSRAKVPDERSEVQILSLRPPKDKQIGWIDTHSTLLLSPLRADLQRSIVALRNSRPIRCPTRHIPP